MEVSTGAHRRILVAVDASANAERAVRYVAGMLGGRPGFQVTLLTILSEPPEDYFTSEDEKRQWLRDEEAKARTALECGRGILTAAGFRDSDVATRLDVRSCASVGECILEAQRELGCGTVVVGRRGISKKEEFIFGSTSSKILHAAKDCSVWAVE